MRLHAFPMQNGHSIEFDALQYDMLFQMVIQMLNIQYFIIKISAHVMQILLITVNNAAM